MLQKLKDVPRFLAIVQRYESSGSPDEQHISYDFKESGVLEGRKQNYSDVFEFCTISELIRKNNDQIELTPLGKNILEHWNGTYELNEVQKEIIAKECLLKDPLARNIVPLFEHFSIRSDDGVLWQPKDKIAFVNDPEVLSLLYQTDVLIKDDLEDIVYLNPRYSQLVTLLLASINENKSMLSLKNLKELLELRDETGAIAEEIVIRFERERLIELGCIGESVNIEQTSLLDVTAGFDLKSYNSDGGHFMKHDRFIEVKGSADGKLSFFLSINEIKKAIEYGPSYWIYFVPNIDVAKREFTGDIQVFNNPALSILNNPRFNKECVRIWVTAKSELGSVEGYPQPPNT